MRVIEVNTEPSARLSGPGSQTDRRTLALDLPAFGLRLRKMALRGEGDARLPGGGGWITETLVAAPSRVQLDGWGTDWERTGVPLCWRHLAIGVCDPSGWVVLWSGWWFLSFTPGSRQIANMVLGEAAGWKGRAWDGILDLFDKRVKRASRLSVARESLISTWSSSASAVGRLGGLLSERGVEQEQESGGA